LVILVNESGMLTVSLCEAKTRLSALVERAAGEEIQSAAQPANLPMRCGSAESPTTSTCRILSSPACSPAKTPDPAARHPYLPLVDSSHATLNTDTRTRIADADNRVLVSAASVWEIEATGAARQFSGRIALDAACVHSFLPSACR
jgi:hypothetical protein